MPQVLDKCVSALKKKGMAEDRAYAICTVSTGWKKKKGGGWTKRKEKNPTHEDSLKRRKKE